jgi:outer membrane lipoprotein-sorting protein
MFKHIIASFLVLGATTVVARSAPADETVSAARIVAAADKVKNPQQPFRSSLDIVEYIRGSRREQTGLVVHAKTGPGVNQNKNLVQYVAPPRDVGKLVLLSGSSMWFYDPASKASIRISPQQRLTGQASEGDVLTVNLAHDYDAKIQGEESIQDADKATRDTWRLELTKSTNDAMYAKLEYWVEKGTYRPIKAKFFSDSGRVLKIAYYRRYEKRLGSDRPTETIIIDGVDTNLVTKITYSDFQPEDLPGEWFQRDYLPRFKIE